MWYMRQIGLAKLLRPEEEIELGRSIALARRVIKESNPERTRFLREVIRRGNKARERMIAANLRLVVENAREFQGFSDLELIDLVQEGTFGLIRDVEEFDHTKGFRFSTYATWWIRQSIRRAIADKEGIMRFPVHIAEDIQKFKRASRFLSRIDRYRDPTIQEIAQELDWQTEKAQFIADLSKSTIVSLDEVVDEGKRQKIHEFLESDRPGPEEIYSEAEVVSLLVEVLKNLTAREREVLMLRFGFDSDEEWTLERVGEKFGVTRERIRQIQEHALRKLRKNESVKSLHG